MSDTGKTTSATKPTPDQTKSALPQGMANLTPDQIDKMDSDALKTALKSVLRSPTSAMGHKDHRSFSSSAE
jgi:hypothetical protein